MPDTRIIELVQEKFARSSWGILGNQGHVLGVDLGGYGLRAALIDLHEHTYTSTHTPGVGAEPQLILDEALQMCHDLLAQSHVKADRLVRIGVGFGGPVDPVRGTIRLSPRMSGWEDFMLKDRFEQAFDTVTLIDNDANLIALGEATFGVAQEYNNLFYLHLSSGVGGGIVIDGRIYQGATATAAEIGHVVARVGSDNGEEAATLEELVSIKGILQRARYNGFFTDNLHDIFSEHPIGQQVVQQTVDLIALHLAQVVALLDPEIIVLGGIVVRIGGSAFVERVAHQINQYTDPQFVRPITVVSSALGNHSIAIGALALALESLQE